MAITRQKKELLTKQYAEWINNSQALILADFQGLKMNELDDLRKKARESGGEFHIIKNTLSKRAFAEQGVQVPEGALTGTTAIAFTEEDAAGLAKVITQYAAKSDFLKIKCGYLNKELLSVEEIKALGELPALPVLRATLLGTILAPASKLARTLAEPARQIAGVLYAYSTENNEPATP